MTSGHRWAFKTRFRASAYGWHGSALASKRLEEAVRESGVLVATALGAIVLRERVTVWRCAGACLVVSGVVLLSL